jgi:cytochrome c-type biogenesis protein CcmH/NrfF
MVIEDEEVPLVAGVTMDAEKATLVKWYMPAAIIVAVGALVDRIAQGRKRKAEKKALKYKKQMSQR